MLFSATNLIAILILGSVVIASAQDQPGTVALRLDQSSSASTPSPTLESPSDSVQDARDPEYLPPGTDPQNRLLLPLGKHIISDQARFWHSPKELKKPAALKTFLPFTAFTGALIAGDSWFAKQVPNSPSQIKRSKSISNYAVFSLVGAAGGAYLFGNLTHNDHLSEAGFLSGEAALNSTLITYAFKEVARRQRPYQGNGNGTFFQSGSSFPSEHSAVAWSVASVIAHEYPGPLTQIGAYGLASAVSLTRVTGKQHFPADVVIGSALGWYLGRQVYRAHHDPELGGAAWGELVETNPEEPRNPANMGSTDVPLDSWVYPAIERLAALGYIKSAYLGMRPWTRMNIAELVAEADEQIAADDSSNAEQAHRTLDHIKAEFLEEGTRLGGAANFGVTLDSIYTRVANISGTPLRDGFHFGQTVVNDYGRPYSQGFNNATGLSAHGEAGPLSFYVRGEYQHAPYFPALSDSARQMIQTVDGTPSAPPGYGVGPINRFDLLEGYIGLQLHDWQLTFGKQELWWGPDQSGPMMFSTNAAPITMLQITRVRPIELPSIFSRLGPMRAQYFLGRLSGQNWVASSNTGYTGSWTRPLTNQPFITGQKVSFQPTANLEVGISATTLFAGTGVPFTTHKFLQAMFSSGNGNPGTASDPGDRRGGFDFSYRIPKLRDWLTVYGDAFTDDQVNPWFAWDKSAVTSGIYLPHLPKVPKLDFRVEGVFTDLPGGTAVVNHGFFYINSRYRSGYTNAGNLIGSWIGRQGQGAEAWSNYWFNAKDTVQFHYRHQTVSNNFVPNGGNLTDAGISGELWVKSLTSFSAAVQWERWNFPVIAATPQTNVMVQFQIGFHPRWTVK